MTDLPCQSESQKVSSCSLQIKMDLGPFKNVCFILHGLRPRALKQNQDLSF